MHVTSAIVVLCIIVNVLADTCPDGSAIYAWGITAQGKRDVVNAHNRIRQMILNGQVPNQPKGKNVLLINGFDDRLSAEGRKVSRQCKMQHVIAADNRWGWVGQNLYIAWSSANTPGQDWNAAVQSWYNEHNNFKYPTTSNGVTGHYTQVVWHDSNTLGCDFIQFYDRSQPRFPYAKLYTCNYGPGGNYQGQAPYQRA